MLTKSIIDYQLKIINSHSSAIAIFGALASHQKQQIEGDYDEN